jgi:hypothetical protein
MLANASQLFLLTTAIEQFLALASTKLLLIR